MVQMGSYWVEYEIDEASLRPLLINMWPKGAWGGQRGSEGVMKAMAIGQGAGMVQMGS